jgi:hypothetical protein
MCSGRAFKKLSRTVTIPLHPGWHGVLRVPGSFRMPANAVVAPNQTTERS